MASTSTTKDKGPHELDTSGADLQTGEQSPPDDGLTEIVLAHHMHFGDDGLPASADNAATVNKKPGDKVRVPRSVASAMIQAGYVNVHPDDTKAVSKILGS